MEDWACYLGMAVTHHVYCVKSFFSIIQYGLLSSNSGFEFSWFSLKSKSIILVNFSRFITSLVFVSNGNCNLFCGIASHFRFGMHMYISQNSTVASPNGMICITLRSTAVHNFHYAPFQVSSYRYNSSTISSYSALKGCIKQLIQLHSH